MGGSNRGDHYVPRGKVGLRDEEQTAQGTDGGGSGSGPRKDPCDISQVVNLIGTDDSILAKLKVGSCLEIQLIKQAGAPRVIAVQGGTLVGSLSGLPALSRLTKCLEDGVPFRATILEIQLPGMVKVKLERGSCA